MRKKARQDMFRLAGVEALKPQESDRQEAARFLTQIGQVNLNVPEEYRAAGAKWLPGAGEDPPIVDGHFDTLETDSKPAGAWIGHVSKN